MWLNTPIYEIAGETVHALRRDATVADASDQLYVVPQVAKDRLWLVSELFYGTDELWWVLAEVNNMQDPLILDMGTKLRIPLRSRLADEGILNQ